MDDHEPSRPYYRGDQDTGITEPNLAATCSYADHICRARGKRSQFTSVSLDQSKIRDFGDVIYELLRGVADTDGHVTIEHESLIEELQRCVKEETRAERARSLLALRRARKRLEGLIDWRFDISGVVRKDLVSWAATRVQKYFQKVR